MRGLSFHQGSFAVAVAHSMCLGYGRFIRCLNRLSYSDDDGLL